jgi:hypothetical protein
VDRRPAVGRMGRHRVGRRLVALHQMVRVALHPMGLVVVQRPGSVVRLGVVPAAAARVGGRP